MENQKNQAIIDMVKKLRIMDMPSIILMQAGVNALAARDRLERQTDQNQGNLPKTG